MRIPRFELLLIALLATPAAAGAEDRVWLTSVDEAFAEARQGDRLIFVDLYADWCGWCKQLEEDVFSTPLFQDFVEDMVLLRVDTEDGAEGTLLQQRYEAYQLPTTLVLDANQIMVAEVNGYAEVEPYLAIMQQKMDAFDELVRGYERFGGTTDLRALSILADEFHSRNDGTRAASLYRQILATEQLPGDKAILVRYQLTNALRLTGQFEEALQELAKTQIGALQAGNTELVERLELMAAQIELDKGDCRKAEAALEEFLGDHRKSPLRGQVHRTLATIRADGYQCL